MPNGQFRQYTSFDDEAVSRAIEAAGRRWEGKDLRTITEIPTTENPDLSIRAQCISVTSGNNEVCLRLPLGLGNVCLPIPFDLPDGTAASACLYICTRWGIPMGVRVRVTAGGIELVEQSFGFGC
jgi:hypothetical protein